MDIFLFILSILGFAVCVGITFGIGKSTTNPIKDESSVWLGFFCGMCALVCFICIATEGCEAFFDPEDGFKHSIHHVNEVRVDTVFTVSSEKTDTMYILNYNKED